MADNPPVITPFENGMELISVANELVGASQVGFTVGARNDPPALSGMAHVSEHNFCRGASEEAIAAVQAHNLAQKTGLTRPVPISERQVNRMYRRFFGSSNGPGINVYTMTSHTGYGHHDLFRSRHLREVFQLMAGMVRDGMYDIRDMRNRNDAIVSPKAFVVERSAVDNETGENDEWPAMAGYRAALKTLYVSNPARYHGDSDPEQLAKVKLGTIKQWGQRHYVPANMRIILIGPTRNAAVKLVREVGLNELPAWTPAPWLYDRSDDLPVLTDVRRVELTRRDITMRHVCMLWPTEAYGSPDELAIRVLIGLIKDRLEDVQREENLVFPGGVYHPFVDWDCSSSHGFITVQFSTKGNDAHCDGLIRSALEVIETIKSDRRPEFEEDVQDGRAYLADEYREDCRCNPGLLTDRIMTALANGDTKLEQFHTFYNDMLRVSPARVRHAAAKYLHCDKFVLTVVRPAS